MWPFARLPQKVTLPETPRLVATLAVAGLLSGLAIVSAYRLTLPTIRENQAAALRRAVFEVLPGAERMQRLEWRDGRLEPVTEADEGVPAVYAGYRADGAFVGYAIPGEGSGYQDTITLIYGYDPARRRIVGLQILESRETPGLGDRIFKDPAFGAQFRDLAVDPAVVLVKETPTEPNQVDAITGATISSTSVVKIVQKSDEAWLARFPETPPPLGAPAGAPPEDERRLVPPGGEKGGPIPGGKLGAAPPPTDGGAGAPAPAAEPASAPALAAAGAGRVPSVPPAAALATAGGEVCRRPDAPSRSTAATAPAGAACSRAEAF